MGVGLLEDMNDTIDFYNGYFARWLVRVCSAPASKLWCCVVLLCAPGWFLPSSQRFLSTHTRERIWNAEAQTLATIS